MKPFADGVTMLYWRPRVSEAEAGGRRRREAPPLTE
jgi:hypothetical protein